MIDPEDADLWELKLEYKLENILNHIIDAYIKIGDRAFWVPIALLVAVLISAASKNELALYVVSAITLLYTALFLVAMMLVCFCI